MYTSVKTSGYYLIVMHCVYVCISDPACLVFRSAAVKKLEGYTGEVGMLVLVEPSVDFVICHTKKGQHKRLHWWLELDRTQILSRKGTEAARR